MPQLKMAECTLELGPTPESEDDFSPEWAAPILIQQLRKEDEIDPLAKIEVVEVRAEKNSLQGILSTTFVLDVDYLIEG